MTAVVIKNGIDVEITLTKEQEELVIEATKPKGYELEYPTGGYLLKNRYDNMYEEAMNGRYRRSFENKKISDERNLRANRLEALVDQLLVLNGWTAGERDCYIFRDCGGWHYEWTNKLFMPEAVYMPIECAIKVCKILNAKEFSLDIE